jgi:hypothetical protein
MLFFVSVSLRVCTFVLIAAALIAPAAYGLAAAKTPPRLEPGRKLYKKFCGQCHALKEAKAIGVGIGATGNTDKGVEDLAGPSFDPLRVTAHQSRLAIQGVWDGHSRVITLLTYKDIDLVSEYVQAATKDHPYRATMPSDFFR